MEQNIQKVIESLSPNERTIIPYLNEGTMQKVHESSELDKTSILRALEFLSNKDLIKISIKQEKKRDYNGFIQDTG